MSDNKIDALRDMLKRLQWAGTAYGSYGETAPKCPICGGIATGERLFIGNASYAKGLGHTKDCELFRLICEHEHD